MCRVINIVTSDLRGNSIKKTNNIRLRIGSKKRNLLNEQYGRTNHLRELVEKQDNIKQRRMYDQRLAGYDY